MKTKILKGLEYFKSLKPSKWRPSDTVWLHKWFTWIDWESVRPVDEKIDKVYEKAKQMEW